MSKGPVVLVVGTTGEFARLVVPELHRRGGAQMGRGSSPSGRTHWREEVEVARPPYGIQELQTLATVYEHYSRYGLGGNSVPLSAALQREPRSLRAYIREGAHSLVV